MSNHSSKITTIVGAQWGDEGKGKITDFFAGESDYVVRFHGGNNAGHTVIDNKKSLAVRLVCMLMVCMHLIFLLCLILMV